MKRLILVLALVALMSGNVLAEGMTIGFMGGLNLANLTGDDLYNKIKLCFGGGVFLNLPLTESISLQPELLFMRKGARSAIFDDAGIGVLGNPVFRSIRGFFVGAGGGSGFVRRSLRGNYEVFDVSYLVEG